jgi:hypothetical protein
VGSLPVTNDSRISDGGIAAGLGRGSLARAPVHGDERDAAGPLEVLDGLPCERLLEEGDPHGQSRGRARLPVAERLLLVGADPDAAREDSGSIR